MTMDSNTHSNMVGPTAVAATTETQIGGADMVLPGDGPMTIKKIWIDGGNVVDAKVGTSKLELKIGGLSGPFKFALFSGQGASSSQGAHWATEIDVNILVPAAARIGAYVYNSEAFQYVTVGIQWVFGHSGRMTYADLVGPTDAGAATRTLIGGAAITLNPGGTWEITNILVSLGNVADDVVSQGKLEVIGGGLSNQDYMIGAGCGAATIGTIVPAQNIKTSIKVAGNTPLYMYVTTVAATVKNHVSIIYR